MDIYVMIRKFIIIVSRIVGLILLFPIMISVIFIECKTSQDVKEYFVWYFDTEREYIGPPL
jgi:hypothetical protein